MLQPFSVMAVLLTASPVGAEAGPSAPAGSSKEPPSEAPPSEEPPSEAPPSESPPSAERSSEEWEGADSVALPFLRDPLVVVYPEEARGAAGEVVLLVTVSAEGRVVDTTVVESPHPALASAVSEVLAGLSFEPARRGTRPVAAKVRFVHVIVAPAPTGAAGSSSPRAPDEETAFTEEAPPSPVGSSGPGDAIPADPDEAGAAAGERAQATDTAEAPPEPSKAPPEEGEVLVQGQSVSATRERSAEAVRVVELETARERAADLGEVLSRAGGVSVRRLAGLGSPSNLTMAGLSGEQLRVFVDGLPIEVSGYGFGLGNIPVNFADHIELYQGVVPQRFGADALGGAIDIVTDRDLRQNKASFAYQVGSFETQRAAVQAQLHDPHHGLVARARAYFDDTRNDYPVRVELVDPNGQIYPDVVRRFHDGYRALGGELSFGVVDRPYAQRLLATAFIGSFAREIQNNPAMTLPYGEVTFGKTVAGSQVRYSHAPAKTLHVDVALAYAWTGTRFLDVGSCRYDWRGSCLVDLAPIRGEISQIPADISVNDHHVVLRSELSWELAPGHTWQVAAAPSLALRNGDDAERSGEEYDALLRTQVLDSLVLGSEWRFTSSDERLENIAFVKGYAQHMQSEELLATGELSEPTRLSVSPGAGDSLKYQFAKEVWAKASYERATRLPSVREVFGDGGLTVRNLGLEPEESHNLNMSLHWDSGLAPWGSLRGQLLGFARLTERQVVLLNAGNYLRYENVLGARTLGSELQARFESPNRRLSVGGNVTYQDARNTSSEGPMAPFEGDRLPNRPYLQGALEGALRAFGVVAPKDELELGLTAFYVHEFFRGWESLGAREAKLVIPSQLTFGAAITHRLRGRRYEIATTLEALNLSDARVFDYYGAERPGRSIFLKVQLQHHQRPL